MFQLIRFPPDALPDVRALVNLSAHQLKTLARLLDSKDAAPPVNQEFEDRVGEALGIDSECAEAVVRLSLILQGTNLDGEKASKAVNDLEQVIRVQSPPDQKVLLDLISNRREDLLDVVIRKPAITQELKRRQIVRGAHPAIGAVRTLVELRALFQRDENGKPVDIDCLIPSMTLELKFERDNREDSAAFNLTEETLDKLIESLQDAKTKWSLLKLKYSDEICE